MRELGVDEEQLRTAVANNTKARISWYSGEEDGDPMVAAWSGHTIPDVTGPGWRVPEADLPSVLVHGTYQRHVSSIRANGLLRTRRDLHFQDPECHQRRWRNDLEVKVTIDPRAASRNGCTFRRTGNGLYLSHESVPASCILEYGPWDNLVGGVAAAASTGETKGLWPPSEPSSFQDEVAEVANKLAQVSLHDQEYLVVEAETLDTRAADREEVMRVLEEENCELASDLDWSADEEDLAVAQAEPGEPDLDEPMGEALGEGSVARSAPGAGSEGGTEGVRLDQPTVVSLQTGDSDEEEATPDWGPTFNLRASPRAWSSSFAPAYDLQGTAPPVQEATPVVLKEGPGAQLATEDPGHSSERQGAARTATPSRGRARASSEPPPQTEEGAPAGEEGPRAPSADPPARGRRKIVFGSSKLLLLASVAQADNANWANLSQALLEANASGTEKAETLERLRQLAESRRVSRLGLEEAARQERARVAQAAEEEERYRAGLNPELQRLERANPVGPRQGEPILTNNRLQADVEAGVPICITRRRHRARERAAKHQAEQAKVGAPPLNSAGSEQRNPGEGGKGLDEDLDAAARRELREFRRTLLQQEGGAQSLRRQPESQARKKRRREERKAKAKAGAPSGAASSLAAVAIAALPSGADAFSPLLALLRNPVPPHAFVVGALLLCVMVTLLTVGAVARFAPGPTKGGRLHNGSIHKGTRRALALLLCWSLVPVAGSEEREPSTPGEQRWDLIYFFFLVGLASVGGASLLMRLVHMLTPRETKDSWTQTTPSEDQGTHSTRLPLRISVTASGGCYHEPGCNHLRGRKARAYRPCLDCLDLPPDLQRAPSPSRTSGSGTRRKQGSRDGGSHRVWGESSSSRTHHPYAQPLLPENLVATPAMVVLLTLAIVGMAMLLQGCGTDLRFSVLSSEASFSPGTKDPRRAGASVRFEDSGPSCPPRVREQERER